MKLVNILKKAFNYYLSGSDIKQALILVQYILNQYFDDNCNISQNLNVKIIIPALYLYNQITHQLIQQQQGQQPNEQVNINILQSRFKNYLSSLKLSQNILSESNLVKIFLFDNQIISSDIDNDSGNQSSILQEFQNVITSTIQMVNCQQIAVQKLNQTLLLFVQVQKQFNALQENERQQHSIKFETLLQIQLVLQSLKYLEVYQTHKNQQQLEKYLRSIKQIASRFNERNCVLLFNITLIMKTLIQLNKEMKDDTQQCQQKQLEFNNLFIKI